MRPYAVLATSLLFLAACATTKPDAPSAETAQRATAADPATATAQASDSQAAEPAAKRVICAKSAVVGTRLPNRRVCRTEEEWRVINDTGQETAREIQRMPLPCEGGAGCTPGGG